MAPATPSSPMSQIGKSQRLWMANRGVAVTTSVPASREHRSTTGRHADAVWVGSSNAAMSMSGTSATASWPSPSTTPRDHPDNGAPLASLSTPSGAAVNATAMLRRPSCGSHVVPTSSLLRTTTRSEPSPPPSSRKHIVRPWQRLRSRKGGRRCTFAVGTAPPTLTSATTHERADSGTSTRRICACSTASTATGVPSSGVCTAPLSVSMPSPAPPSPSATPSPSIVYAS
mmetsp:Transcript_12128/g.42570  ORF Transcript_12128/g.42570 Transcript_12128/m.42570 type:complete len:229 (+) Transcript_12128:744-1430(+)